MLAAGAGALGVGAQGLLLIHGPARHRVGLAPGLDLGGAQLGFEGFGPGRDPERALVLMAHQPKQIDLATQAGADLQLSGHTHGGQVTALGWPPLLPEGSGRFVAGWYDSAQGPAYVSRGTGTSLIPVRFFCRPELPLIRLTRA